MRDAEIDPKVQLALEQAEAAAPPDYPNWKRGAVAALIGGIIFSVIGGVLRLIISAVTAFAAASSGAAAHPAAAGAGTIPVQLLIFFLAGALIFGAVGAFRPAARR